VGSATLELAWMSRPIAAEGTLSVSGAAVAEGVAPRTLINPASRVAANAAEKKRRRIFMAITSRRA